MNQILYFNHSILEIIIDNLDIFSYHAQEYLALSFCV
jgi:late competence protein required for DNA uptake (superfamily II DNA/RNA helicase)